MDPSVSSVPILAQVACRKDQEPRQFKAYCMKMPDRCPFFPDGGGVEVTA
jgi:hypothetical protein